MIQNLFSMVALIVAGWVICCNWTCILLYLVKGKHSSWIPILGGGLGCLGCILSPYPILNELWWVPLLIDWGCLPGLTYSLLFFALLFIRSRKK